MTYRKKDRIKFYRLALGNFSCYLSRSTMHKLLFLLLSVWGAMQLSAQTTDLSITVEAQDLGGNSISRAHFYERYQYQITISNTGAPVSSSSFDFMLSSVEEIESAVAQNILGGAASPANVNIAANRVAGDLPNMPNSSSLEIIVTVRASPTFLGGATITATVDPPAGTTDVNPATNSSVISIIMTERPIDFQITQTQITPVANGNLAAWGDSVTYEMTISNNSAIDYPLENFSLSVRNVNRAGSTIYTFQDLNCVGSNGMNCPTLAGGNPITSANVIAQFTYYNHRQEIVFPAGASFTLRATYSLDQGDCSSVIPNEPLEIGNVVNIESYVNNTGFSTSNRIETTTLLNDECLCTDLISTLDRISPTGNNLTSWSDIVTYELTIANDGAFDILSRANFINTSTFNTGIEILSVACLSTTGSINCGDITVITTPDLRWITENFIFPANSSATFSTTVRFIPPDCTPDGVAPTCKVQVAISDRDQVLFDCNRGNNFEEDGIIGLPVMPCVVDPPPGSTISLTEVQTTPSPGAGPYPYGDIAYEIVMSNVDTLAHTVKFKDEQFSDGTGILQSIVCTGTTGGASCPTNLNANIGVANMMGDTFWEILDTDGFIMPPNSSITYEKVINWKPECSVTVTDVRDKLELSTIDPNLQVIETVGAGVVTPMVPCVDIVVQTFPSVTSAPINTNLEWVVDITNSNISVDASNLSFNNRLHPDFIITGTPTCTLITGNATCISTFNITGNEVEAIIPFMESGSTIQVRIPVTSPSYGGSFENRAEVQPDFTLTGENTPDSNISSSSLFILTTQTSKSFTPAVINTGDTSILSFTLTNSVGFPAQSNIAFLDNLPPEITLVENAFWINQNNATGTFVDVIGSSTIGIRNLSFPAGTEEVSFGVQVTSAIADFYINDFQNFSDLNNIDISTAFASLEVLPVLDLAISKTVDNLNPNIEDPVTFTILVENLESATAIDVEVIENLPSGYDYVSHNASLGNFDPVTGLWEVGDMAARSSATLEITVDLNIPGDFINVVRVSSGTMLTDVDLENNTAQAFTRPDCLVIPEGFSPNTDGTNDTFFIRCIELYPESQLKIFNRYGSIVYKATGYENDWNGMPNAGLLHDSGRLLPTGTYFWQLDLKDGSQVTAGWVYINY